MYLCNTDGAEDSLIPPRSDRFLVPRDPVGHIYKHACAVTILPRRGPEGPHTRSRPAPLRIHDDSGKLNGPRLEFLIAERYYSRDLRVALTHIPRCRVNAALYTMLLLN